MAPSGIQNHSDKALILSKEVYRQRRRRRRGGGSVQSQLEVQQIDTFDSGDTVGSGGGGHGQEHLLDCTHTQDRILQCKERSAPPTGGGNTKAQRRPSPHLRYLYLAARVAACVASTPGACNIKCCSGPLSLEIMGPLKIYLA